MRKLLIFVFLLFTSCKINFIADLYPSDLIDLANSESIRYNISSLLESNVARLYYMHLCSAFNIKDTCGIATNIFFESDLCSFPPLINGELVLSNKPGLGIYEINL